MFEIGRGDRSCDFFPTGRSSSMVEISAFSRRRFLCALATSTTPVAFLLRTRAIAGNDSPSLTLEPTPAVGDPLKPTPEETSGPFFRPDSPLKKNLREPGLGGSPIKLLGFVLDPKGNSAPGVLLDFWHADDQGKYDLKGYRCRGHQFSDADGGYALETILPGLYPGRTRHYHVRLQAAHGPILSTQLYFPNESRNETDSLFRPDLLIKLRKGAAGSVAIFNFVVQLSS
jgi:protocatechuate 3,4-dioxygenase beta subunit